jgi:hypothetical protein
LSPFSDLQSDRRNELWNQALHRGHFDFQPALQDLLEAVLQKITVFGLLERFNHPLPVRLKGQHRPPRSSLKKSQITVTGIGFFCNHLVRKIKQETTSNSRKTQCQPGTNAIFLYERALKTHQVFAKLFARDLSGLMLAFFADAC